MSDHEAAELDVVDDAVAGAVDLAHAALTQGADKLKAAVEQSSLEGKTPAHLGAKKELGVVKLSAVGTVRDGRQLGSLLHGA